MHCCTMSETTCVSCRSSSRSASSAGVSKTMTHSWGQRVIRFYDLDGNLIEVGTPM